MDILKDKLVAHCGLVSSDAPENSLRALRRAVDAGFAVECDVQVTRSGEVVVFHDHSLTRLCQRSGTVDELTRKTRLLAHLSATDQSIPSLGEVLTMVAGRAGVFVDLKPRASVRALSRRDAITRVAAVAAVLEGYSGPVAVMSWDPRQLRWLRDNAPEVVRIQSGGVGGSLLLVPGMAAVLDDLRLNWVSDPHAVSYNAGLLPRASVQAARRAGVPVLAWVARDEASLRRALAHADNVLFEGFTPSSTDPDDHDPDTSLPSLTSTAKGALRARSTHVGRTRQAVSIVLPLVTGAVLSSASPGRAWAPAAVSAALGLLAPRQWLAAGAGGALGASSIAGRAGALLGAAAGSSVRAVAGAVRASGRG